MSFLDFAPFLDWSYNLRQTTDKSQHWTFRFDYVHPPFISMWLEQNSTLETLNQGKRGSGSPKPMFSSQYVLLHTTTTFKFASILSCASLSKFLCGQDFRSLQYFVISQIKIKTFIFGHLSQSSFKQNLVFLGLDRPMVWLLLFMMRVCILLNYLPFTFFPACGISSLNWRQKIALLSICSRQQLISSWFEVTGRIAHFAQTSGASLFDSK